MKYRGFAVCIILCSACAGAQPPIEKPRAPSHKPGELEMRDLHAHTSGLGKLEPVKIPLAEKQSDARRTTMTARAPARLTRQASPRAK